MDRFYYSFIPNFAYIVCVLSDIIKSLTKFLSVPKINEALFQFSKKCNLLSLSLPPSPFGHLDGTHLRLVADSSSDAIGSGLHQMVDGTPVPIDFFSKKLTKLHHKYSTFDRGLLDAYLIVLHFKSFVEGREVTLCSAQTLSFYLLKNDSG